MSAGSSRRECEWVGRARERRGFRGLAHTAYTARFSSSVLPARSASVRVQGRVFLPAARRTGANRRAHVSPCMPIATPVTMLARAPQRQSDEGMAPGAEWDGTRRNAGNWRCSNSRQAGRRHRTQTRSLRDVKERQCIPAREEGRDCLARSGSPAEGYWGCEADEEPRAEPWADNGMDGWLGFLPKPGAPATRLSWDLEHHVLRVRQTRILKVQQASKGSASIADIHTIHTIKSERNGHALVWREIFSLLTICT